MGSKKRAGIMRFAGCAALLALLAQSSYMGSKPPQIVAVPVTASSISADMMASASIEKTQLRLEQGREQALALLQSVLDDPRAHTKAVEDALQKKAQLAARIETETAVTALLAYMGFADTAVVMGERGLSIIVPWQTAENEQNRVRMIDAAVSQSGLSAESVKIILSKK